MGRMLTSPLLRLAFLLSVALALCVVRVDARGAVLPVTLNDEQRRDLRPSTDQRLVSRAQRCSSSNDCGRNSYCSWGSCRHKKYDGQSCSSYHSCVSGSCDARTNTCQSSNLHLGTRCSSSLSCKSGNCQNSYCTRKQVVGAYCYKAANCLSANCDKTRARCLPAGNGISGDPELVPTLPWDSNLSDLENLRPLSSAELFFSDQGVLDLSVSTLFAKIQTDFNTPAVVLSHSSWVGEPKCSVDVGQSGNTTTLEIPFKNQASYDFAKQTWAAINGAPWLLVTHTDACGAPHPDKTDERTYWLANAGAITFDDKEHVIDVVAHEVAHEIAVYSMDISFGATYTPGQGSSNNTAGSSGSGSTESCSSFSGNSEDGLDAAACGSSFDKTLDDLEGYYDFTDPDNFSQELQAIAPGLDDYNVDDYSIDEGSEEISKRGFLSRLSFIDKGVKRLAAAVKQVAVSTASAVKTTAQVAKLGLAAAVNNSPLSGIVGPLLGDSNFDVDRQFNLNVSPNPKGFKDTKNWGSQYLLYNYSLPESKQGSGNTKKEANINIFCVDCKVKGQAVLAGRVGYKGGQKGLAVGYVYVNGSVLASAYIGLEGDASYTYTAKKTIATVPLYGFAIRDIVVVGPALQLDSQFKLELKAEGTLLVGANYSIDGFQAKLDLLSSKSFTQTGFDPKFQKRIEATGEVTAAASLGLPVSILVGVKVKPISLDLSAGIRTVPAVGLSGTFAYDSREPIAEECNGGVNISASIRNDVIANLGEKDFDLHQWNKTLGSTCVQILKAGESQNDTSSSQNTTTSKRSILDTRAVLVANSTNSTQTTPSVTTNTTATSTTATETATSYPSISPNDQYGNPDFVDDSLDQDAQNDAKQGVSIASNQGVNGTETEDNINFVQLLESSGKYVLALDDTTDNFVLQPAQSSTSEVSTFFAADTNDNLIFHTTEQTLFVYYPKELAKFHASRVRGAPVDAVPQSSDLVALTPLTNPNDSSGKAHYAFISTDGVFLLPVLCTYQNAQTASKIFVVDANNIDAGIANLKSTQTDNTVTGGLISNCQAMAFEAPTIGGY